MSKSKAFGLSVALCACGTGSKSNVAFTDSGQTAFAAIELEMTQPVSNYQLTALKKVSVKQFYDSLMEQSSDDAMVINGLVVRDVRTQLKAAEPFFTKLGQKYSSWGEFAERSFDLSIAPGRAITREVFTNLTKNFANSSGVFAKLKQLPPTFSAKKTSKTEPALQLTDSRQDRSNLAALAALSLAIQFARGPGLGLVENTMESTNSIEGSACSSLTDMSAINRIEISNGKDSSLCSGTFFKGDKLYDYLLTADHCTADPNANWITKNASGANVRGIVVRNGSGPTPKDVAKPVQGSHDISVVAFPPGTARGYMRLAPQGARAGDPVKMAGFGQRNKSFDQPGPVGTLNCGSNIVGQVVEQQGVITLYGYNFPSYPGIQTGTGSVGSRGDSGGPLIRIDQDGKPEIIGVTSNGNIYFGDKIPMSGGYTNYTDINSSWSKGFIDQRSNFKSQQLPVCSNGSNNGDGTGTQPGIGGLDNKTCLVPAPPQSGKPGTSPSTHE